MGTPRLNPSTASVLKALPSDRSPMTCQDIGKAVRLGNRPTTDYLVDFYQLGLVLTVGQRITPARGAVVQSNLKWRLSANGQRVMKVLTA